MGSSDARRGVSFMQCRRWTQIARPGRGHRRLAYLSIVERLRRRTPPVHGNGHQHLAHDDHDADADADADAANMAGADWPVLAARFGQRQISRPAAGDAMTARSHLPFAAGQVKCLAKARLQTAAAFLAQAHLSLL